ncbi:MAG: FAD-binding oxidoreductase [Chloroflexota bacterium]
MKRWNGWGDETHDHPLPEGAADFLETRIGVAQPPQDAAFEAVLRSVPAGRLPAALADHSLVRTDAETRLRHARGQSFPDWVALRTGDVGAYPDGVAFPHTEDDVRALLDAARAHDVRVIPYGGGTSVAGHINPAGDAPVLTVAMTRMNRLIDLDTQTLHATFGAGIAGPDLEAQLRAHSFTLGHYPQSFEYSTLGGWVATRSSGQQSLHYGRIERLFAGGRMLTPQDTLDLPPFPASAAGPDLRELVLGSEGRMGIITEATVRITQLPEQETFRAVFFPTFEAGVEAVRAISQAKLPLSMLRLSTAVETATNLALAGQRALITTVETLLAARGAGEEKSMLLYGYTGPKAMARAVLKETAGIARAHGGVDLGIGKAFGSTWAKSRFRTPYLRNTLWDHGYAVDTVETATTWTNTLPMLRAMEKALKHTMAEHDEKIHVFTHLSHLYPYGTSVYTTYVFRLADDPAQTLARWQALKGAVSQAVVANGGTISHQHGVGTDHAPYLPVEKGPAGMAVLNTILRHFDPDGIMNPGKLVLDQA